MYMCLVLFLVLLCDSIVASGYSCWPVSGHRLGLYLVDDHDTSVSVSRVWFSRTKKKILNKALLLVGFVLILEHREGSVLR